ncbi:MAG: putative kinase [Myxococcota bacterium]|jgi:predicted kinase
MSWFSHTPSPPHWRMDWPAIVEAFSWVAAMEGCEQDPIYHAEGNVLIHTRMVCEALIANPAWRALPQIERDTVFAAALLHDVAKPFTSVANPGGRISTPHHSPRGAVMARGLLWRMGVDPQIREQVCGLVQWHQVPYFCIDQPDPLRSLIRVSQTARCDHVALLCESDVRGRICDDPERMLESIALFVLMAEEEGCLSQPWPFASDHARVLWFRSPSRDPRYAAYDDTRGEVVMMSGLPGAGKDTWIADNLPGHPVVSLDAIRTELSVHPSENQGRVVQLARERAREHLRLSTPFVWNATTLTRHTRKPVIGLFGDYNMRIRAVCMETPPVVLFARNADREDSVPRKIIERMISRWQPPDTSEVHIVQRVGASKRSP